MSHSERFCVYFSSRIVWPQLANEQRFEAKFNRTKVGLHFRPKIQKGFAEESFPRDRARSKSSRSARSSIARCVRDRRVHSPEARHTTSPPPCWLAIRAALR